MDYSRHYSRIKVCVVGCELRRCRELGFYMDTNKNWHYTAPAESEQTDETI